MMVCEGSGVVEDGLRVILTALGGLWLLGTAPPEQRQSRHLTRAPGQANVGSRPRTQWGRLAAKSCSNNAVQLQCRRSRVANAGQL